MADAAATIIANAVDLPGHPSIVRVPAHNLVPDSDLGDRLVTRAVGELSEFEIATALHAGVTFARFLVAKGLIHAAALHLRGETNIVGLERFPTARKPENWELRWSSASGPHQRFTLISGFSR